MGESFRIVEGFGQHSKRRDCELSIVGALFLLRDDGALLLQLRDEKPNLRHAGMWVPPGGHIEADESVEAEQPPSDSSGEKKLEEALLILNDPFASVEEQAELLSDPAVKEAYVNQD